MAAKKKNKEPAHEIELGDTSNGEEDVATAARLEREASVLRERNGSPTTEDFYVELDAHVTPAHPTDPERNERRRTITIKVNAKDGADAATKVTKAFQLIVDQSTSPMTMAARAYKELQSIVVQGPASTPSPAADTLPVKGDKINALLVDCVVCGALAGKSCFWGDNTPPDRVHNQRYIDTAIHEKAVANAPKVAVASKVSEAPDFDF